MAQKTQVQDKYLTMRLDLSATRALIPAVSHYIDVLKAALVHCCEDETASIANDIGYYDAILSDMKRNVASHIAALVEQADTEGLNPSAERRDGSNPSGGTTNDTLDEIEARWKEEPQFSDTLNSGMISHELASGYVRALIAMVRARDRLLRRSSDKLCHYATNYPEPDALAIINECDRMILDTPPAQEPTE